MCVHWRISAGDIVLHRVGQCDTKVTTHCVQNLHCRFTAMENVRPFMCDDYLDDDIQLEFQINMHDGITRYREQTNCNVLQNRWFYIVFATKLHH